LKRSKTRRKRIVITGVTDMEDKAASAAMVNALASRVETVIRELGLTARVRIGKDARGPRVRPRKHPNPRVVAARASRAPGTFPVRSRSVAVDRPQTAPERGMEEGQQ